MARFNEILVGRYNRFLQKLFQIKGAPPSPQLAGDIQPSFAVFSGVENRYLEAWQKFGNTIVAAAVAAQNSAVRVRNPVASNVVAVLEKVSIANAIADLITLNNQVADANLGTTAGSVRLDARQGALSGSSIICSFGNNVVGGQNFGGYAVPATSFDLIVFENQEMVILPGDQIDFRNTTVNNAMRITLVWRERFLEESERA